MKHLYKRIIMIASYAVLGVAVIALTVTLILTINSNTKTVDELNSKNEQLQEELIQTETKRDSLASQLESTKASLETQKKLVSKYQAAASEYQSEVESLKNKLISSDPDNITYSDSFDTVDELMVAIKKHPTEYVGKQVKVVGTILKDEEGGSVTLSDVHLDYEDIINAERYNFLVHYYSRNYPSIATIIADDVQYTVLETGDYVKMYGTVTISNGEIYLSNCEYSMITTRDERK